MNANGSILSRITAIDEPKRVTRQDPPIVAPRLTTSVFAIDHRGELIREMRADADILDKRAAETTALALSLRLSADHLEQHPPE